MLKKILLTGSMVVLTTGTNVYANNENEFSQLIKLTTKISSMVHELQKERGLSAGYIGSKGNSDFEYSLRKQREITNLKIANFKSTVFKLSKYKNINDILETTTIINNKLKKLKPIRKNITNLDLTLNQTLNYYSTLNDISLKVISKLSKYAKHERKLHKMLSSYYFFQLIKERNGQIRGLGSGVLSQNEFKNAQYLNWIKLNSDIKGYKAAFEFEATEQFKEEYDAMLSHPIFKTIENKIKIIQSKNLDGNFNLDAKEWFNEMTVKINQFKILDDKYTKLILNEIKNSKVDLNNLIIDKSKYQDIFNGASYTFFDINGLKRTVKENKGEEGKLIQLRMKKLYNTFKNNEKLRLENVNLRLNDGQVKVIDLNRYDIFRINVSEEINLAKKIVLGYIDGVLYIGLNRDNPAIIDLRDEDRFMRNRKVYTNKDLTDLQFNKARIKVRIIED